MLPHAPASLEENSLDPQRLFDAVQFVPGVGPSKAVLLNKLGIHRACDLLFYFPRSFEATAPLRNAEELRENERVSLAGHVVEVDERITQAGKHMLGALIEISPGAFVRLMWFNQPFRKQDLRVGRRVLATGTLRSTVISWEIVQPQVVYLNEDEVPASRKPLPIYGLTEGLNQSGLRRIFRTGAKRLVPLVEDVLPEPLRRELNVLPIGEALEQLHWPDSMEQAEAARRRFVMQEMFVLQLAIGMQRQNRRSSAQAPACAPEAKIHSRILNRLGFILTNDQRQAIDDIGQDMARTVPMNRLLQGDVGCGKTVVAQYALLLAVAHGYQAALMAPTEVLARQHDASLRKNLDSSRVRIGLLTGSLTRSERDKLTEQTAAGEIDLLIGTQALLNESLDFHRLALVIVDEQHKFGVEQRAKLRRDGFQPHYLVLSATPIPRTIAMTLFGDLDVSIIREMPSGRPAKKTYLGDAGTLESWWRFVDEQIAAGHQAYVITPRVSESESSEAAGEGAAESTRESAGAVQTAEQLASGRFRHRRVGLLHGQLDSAAKEKVLTEFAAGEIDVLVATTVVEVGIDVPNATVMTILDADRLGLAQLHQLRGRVGRGRFPGYVCAFPSVGTDAADHDRLQAFVKTSDGFELAEMDLKLRGAGDLIGTRQHGASWLRVADLARDGDAAAAARAVAKRLLESDPQLESPELAKLKKQVLSRHGERLGIGDVG